MQEPKVITICDVMDSTVMHINKGNALFAKECKGNAHGTQGERSNPDNSQHTRLLVFVMFVACVARRFIIEREHSKRRSRENERRSREEPPAGMTYIFHCPYYIC